MTFLQHNRAFGQKLSQNYNPFKLLKQNHITVARMINSHISVCTINNVFYSPVPRHFTIQYHLVKTAEKKTISMTNNDFLYRADYVPHTVVPRRSRVGSKYEPNKEYMDLDTMYKQDYCPHLVRPPIAYRPLQCRQTCKDKMDVISTYRGKALLAISTAYVKM